MIAVVIALIFGGVIGVETAHAKSLAEYDAEIATQEEILAEKEADLEAKQLLLNGAVRTVYKDYTTKDILSVLMNEEDLDHALQQLNYIYQVSDYYRRSVEDVHEAKILVEETIKELENMRTERQARAINVDEAALIQYSQSGEEWSSLPYWGVSISYAGCGLCAYTSIIDILLEEDYTPTEMLDIRGDWRGMDHWVHDCTGTPDGSSHHDFTLEKFGIDTYECERSAEALAEELKDGEACALVLVHGVSLKINGGGSWWTGGHFINVFAYDDEGFHVHDSATSYSQGRNVIYSMSEMDGILSGATVVIYHK